MEMTIDDCIKGLLINKEDDTYVLGNETIDFAIKIMRKYQKIEQAYSDYLDDLDNDDEDDGNVEEKLVDRLGEIL